MTFDEYKTYADAEYKYKLYRCVWTVRVYQYDLLHNTEIQHRIYMFPSVDEAIACREWIAREHEEGVWIPLNAPNKHCRVAIGYEEIPE